MMNRQFEDDMAMLSRRPDKAPTILCSIIETLFRTAQLHPERPAIIDNGNELSYLQLATQVCALATRIGSDCGTVGVLVTRSANTIIALLSVFAAGGVYCPIDPKYPISRQQTLLHASACNTVITTRSDLTVPDNVRILMLPEQPLAKIHTSQTLETTIKTFKIVDLDDAAYLLFTSGSTGVPKGVLTTHRAIATSVHSLRELLHISPIDRILQFAALNWDTCFEEIFPALTAGAALVIDDEAYTGSHPRLLRMLAARDVTILDLPTAFWHELVHYLKEDCATLPRCIRAIIIGGEAARSARLAHWCTLETDHIRLINTYGCTETTLVTHATDLHGPFAPSPLIPWTEVQAVPIGQRMSHVIEHITEDGELFIAGPALALAYLNLPELTAERFSLRDFGDKNGIQRYYRSGDRVSRNANGQLVHHGRLDSQIKIRGIRVDPGEVESEISTHPEVKLVAVMGISTTEHSSLIAYVVPHQRTSQNTNQSATTATVAATCSLSTDLFLYLRSRLPAHLVPSKINIVPELIYTTSGKVDRTRLHERYAKPHTQTQKDYL